MLNEYNKDFYHQVEALWVLIRTLPSKTEIILFPVTKIHLFKLLQECRMSFLQMHPEFLYLTLNLHVVRKPVSRNKRVLGITKCFTQQSALRC